MSAAPFSPRRHGPLLALLLLAAALFLPPYAASFVGDDFAQLWRIRDLIETPWRAGIVFAPEWTPWYYRPLQNLWFLGNRLTWGYHPFGYYALGMTAHLLTVSLLYRAARDLRVTHPAAIAGAAIFALLSVHQQAVGWISSIAIVLATLFSLLALHVWTRYLATARVLPLLLTGAAFLAALAASETAFVLPFVLAAAGVAAHGQSRPQRATVAAGVLTTLLLSCYVILQVSRPNLHLNVGDDSAATWLAALNPATAGAYMSAVTGRLLTGRPLDFGTAAVPVGLAAAAVLAAALWRAPRPTQIGLGWAILQLGFTYLAIWVQDPAVFDSRHLYAAAAGLALAIGGALPALVGRLPNRGQAGAVCGVILAVFLLIQVIGLRQNQARWVDLTDLATDLETQLKGLLPAVNADTHLYATRFLYSPPYFPLTAAVWYEKNEIPGGTLSELRRRETLSPNDYVFDQTSGDRLYLLMPELQAHRRTMLVWRGPPAAAVTRSAGGTAPLAPNRFVADALAGPAGAVRLALQVEGMPGESAALGYDLRVPTGTDLSLGWRGPAGMRFRLIWEGADGVNAVLLDEQSDGADPWRERRVDLSAQWGAEGRLWFEVEGAGTAYWANPRFVSD